MMILDRSHPASDDSWDGKWLRLTVEVAAGLFRGIIPGAIRADELVNFHEELNSVYRSLHETAEFSTMEDWLRISVIGVGRGGIEVSCVLRDEPGVGKTLEFRLDIDQTYLEPMLLELGRTVSEHPVIGSAEDSAQATLRSDRIVRAAARDDALELRNLTAQRRELAAAWEHMTMGLVLTEARFENIKDLWAVEQGLRAPDQARSITIVDALVDTGATLLSLPTSLIERLGLSRFSSRRVTSSTGPAEAALYDAVRLTIMGRSCTMDVLEVSDGVPALIGQIPLEYLDFVVDPQSQTLIGNPAHGGEHILEMY